MKVKEIICAAAGLLGKETVAAYLSGESASAGTGVMNEINSGVRLLNVLLCEIAGSYLPMIKKETPEVKDGKIYVSDTKDVDTSDSGTVLAVVNNMYTISSLGIKMTNNIGTYTMIGVGVASLLLVLTIPASRRRDYFNQLKFK